MAGKWKDWTRRGLTDEAKKTSGFGFEQKKQTEVGKTGFGVERSKAVETERTSGFGVETTKKYEEAGIQERQKTSGFGVEVPKKPGSHPGRLVNETGLLSHRYTKPFFRRYTDLSPKTDEKTQGELDRIGRILAEKCLQTMRNGGLRQYHMKKWLGPLMAWMAVSVYDNGLGAPLVTVEVQSARPPVEEENPFWLFYFFNSNNEHGYGLTVTAGGTWQIARSSVVYPKSERLEEEGAYNLGLGYFHGNNWAGSTRENVLALVNKKRIYGFQGELIVDLDNVIDTEEIATPPVGPQILGNSAVARFNGAILLASYGQPTVNTQRLYEINPTTNTAKLLSNDFERANAQMQFNRKGDTFLTSDWSERTQINFSGSVGSIAFDVVTEPFPFDPTGQFSQYEKDWDDGFPTLGTCQDDFGVTGEQIVSDHWDIYTGTQVFDYKEVKNWHFIENELVYTYYEQYEVAEVDFEAVSSDILPFALVYDRLCPDDTDRFAYADFTATSDYRVTTYQRETLWTGEVVYLNNDIYTHHKVITGDDARETVFEPGGNYYEVMPTGATFTCNAAYTRDGTANFSGEDYPPALTYAKQDYLLSHSHSDGCSWVEPRNALWGDVTLFMSDAQLVLEGVDDVYIQEIAYTGDLKAIVVLLRLYFINDTTSAEDMDLRSFKLFGYYNGKITDLSDLLNGIGALEKIDEAHCNLSTLMAVSATVN